MEDGRRCFYRYYSRFSLEYCRQHNVTLQENVEEAHLSIADNKTLQENVEDSKPIIVLEDVKVTLNGRKEVNVMLFQMRV